MYAGVQEVVASVSDIGRIERVFTRIFGWRAQRLPDAPREQWRAWQVPRGVTRIEQRLLIPARDTKGCVRLVRFHGAKARVMRSSARTWDTGGIFDIDVYAHDVRGIYRALQREGWSAYGDPADYSWAGFDVCEVVATGPDGLVIALIEPKHPPRAKFPRYRVSRVFNSACIVRDFAATKQFFEEGLGWRYIVESEVRDAIEPGQLMLGLPLPLARDAVRRIGIVHPTGENDGSIEPVSMPQVGGRDFAADCVAPNLGWLCWRYPVVDARASAKRFAERGIPLYSAVRVLRIAPYGEVVTFSIRTPDGAILEFYERAAAPPSRSRRSPSS
jgi:catechol 2,3-dioxygenase-like lactoylglutathione lyase family enzyme